MYCMFILCQTGHWECMGTKTQSLSLRNLQAVVKEKLRTHLDPEKYGQCNDGAKHGGCGKQEGT